jgi:predicted patatin/cPLA2 family phospholipase
MKDKIILYLGGGGMSGVFGEGVMTTLQEMNFYDKIEAIYAESAGAMNGAVFLSKKTKLGGEIYLKHLGRKFVLFPNLLITPFQRLWHRFIHRIPKHKTRNLVDIDYLFRVVRKKKPIDPEEIRKQPIKFYVKLLNVNNGEIDYLNVKKHDTLKVLKAATSVAPFYFGSQKINGKEYIDANIKTPIGLEYLLATYPNQKIVLVLNLRPKRSFIFYLRNFIEGTIATTMYKAPPLFRCALGRENSVRRSIKLAQKNKRVLFIYPSANDPTMPWTTDYKKLKTTYEMGKKAAKKIIEFAK